MSDLQASVILRQANISLIEDIHLKLKLIGTVACEAAIGFAGLVVAVIICAVYAAGSPSEAFCEEMFFSRKTDFEKLRKMMASENKIQEVGLDQFEPYFISSGKWVHREYDHFGTTTFTNEQVARDFSVPIDRLREYHALCLKLGLDGVMRDNVESHRDETEFFLEDGMGRLFFFKFIPLVSEVWLGPRVEIVYNRKSEKDPSSAPPGWSLFKLSTQKYTSFEHSR